MIEKLGSIKDTIHFEPLTEVALLRYDLHIEDPQLKLSVHSAEAVKDLDFIIALIKFYSEPSDEGVTEFRAYSLSVISDYLMRTHAFYRDRILPKMHMAIKSIKVIFPDHPIAIVLDHFYRNYQDELLEHMELEENRLFPYAEKLYDGRRDVEYSVKEFRQSHDHNIEDHLEDILVVIEDEFPEVARAFAYRTFKHLLDQFRMDLEVHHLIEERVYLYKIEELETQFN